MVFSSAILGRALVAGPPMKRYAEAFRLEWVWGTWDGDSVTTGAIDLKCANVLFCNVEIDAASAVAHRVQLDVASAGSVTISEFTSSHTGRFLALVSHLKK